MQVALYHALSGKLRWVLGSHAGMVYSMCWARDDSSLVTASADFTAKVWHLPQLPGPALASSEMYRLDLGRTGSAPATLISSSKVGARPQVPHGYVPGWTGTAVAACPNSGSATGGAVQGGSGAASCGASVYAELAGTNAPTAHHAAAPMLTQTTGAAAATEAAAAAGVYVGVLQHTCFVYAAELHTLPHPVMTVVTAGFDGLVRLWSAEGVVLYSLQVSVLVAPVCNEGGPARPLILVHH